MEMYQKLLQKKNILYFAEINMYPGKNFRFPQNRNYQRITFLKF